jgi:hypothetical protein
VNHLDSRAWLIVTFPVTYSIVDGSTLNAELAQSEVNECRHLDLGELRIFVTGDVT